jgi:antitoxin CptB
VTGSGITSDGLDPRRRRLLYQSWRRGMREMDLILGGFADVHIATLSDAELEAFEHVAEAPDDKLYSWISGARPVDPLYDTEMYRRISAFAHQSKSV